MVRVSMHLPKDRLMQNTLRGLQLMGLRSPTELSQDALSQVHILKVLHSCLWMRVVSIVTSYVRRTYVGHQVGSIDDK